MSRQRPRFQREGGRQGLRHFLLHLSANGIRCILGDTKVFPVLETGIVLASRQLAAPTGGRYDWLLPHL